jgi:predicted HTH domain antitoxin
MMSLVISEEIVKASGLSEQELIIELVLLLFQQEKVSLGKAAELLNISQVRFQKILSDRGINIHYDVEELQEDIQHLTAKGWL